MTSLNDKTELREWTNTELERYGLCRAIDVPFIPGVQIGVRCLQCGTSWNRSLEPRSLKHGTIAWMCPNGCNRERVQRQIMAERELRSKHRHKRAA
jgi:hypothetical protein